MSDVMFQTFKHKIGSEELQRWGRAIPELMIKNASFVMEYPSASLSETIYVYSISSKYFTMLDMLDVGWRDDLPKDLLIFVSDEYYYKICRWKEFVDQQAKEGISTIKAIRQWTNSH